MKSAVLSRRRVNRVVRRREADEVTSTVHAGELPMQAMFGRATQTDALRYFGPTDQPFIEPASESSETLESASTFDHEAQPVDHSPDSAARNVANQNLSQRVEASRSGRAGLEANQIRVTDLLDLKSIFSGHVSQCLFDKRSTVCHGECCCH